MSDPTTTDSPCLPAVRRIFDELKSGRHWSFGDDVYPELASENFGGYQRYFAQIGIELNSDPRGFFFATLDREDEESAANKAAPSFILFTAIWIEAIADKGLQIHDALFNKEHSLDDLPHFSAENHRRLMVQADISSAEELGKLLKRLHGMGFITQLPNASFKLRAPFHRLLDVCLEYANTPESGPADEVNPTHTEDVP